MINSSLCTPFLHFQGQQLRSYSRAAVALARSETKKAHRLSSIVVQVEEEKEEPFTVHNVRQSTGSEDAHSLHDSAFEEPIMQKY